MILYLLFLIAMLWIIQFRYKRRRLYQLVSKIPVASGHIPVLGLAHHFVGSTENIMSSLQRNSYECMRLGGTTTGWLGHLLYFTLVDPANIETVLKSCLEKDDIYQFVSNIMGNGIVFAPVPIWRKHRKIMIPALTPKIVNSFIDIFATQTNILAEKLEPLCGAGEFSVWPFINRYALQSICETTFGVKIKAHDDTNVAFLTALNRVTNLMSERMFHLWLQPDWLYRLFRGRYAEQEKYRHTLVYFLDEVISSKRKEMASNKTSEIKTTLNILENYKNQSFLELLITTSGGERGYSDIELREEVLILILAGTDTTAVAIANTLVLLGKYPKIQEKVHQEISNVFGDSDRPLNEADFPKLQYLERVLKESLRLYPPGPFLVRKVLKETALPSGHTLPAGSGVLISIWGTHRNPKYWGPDAECFDPDRFLPERFNLQHSCCYLPFSNGPRNCIAYQYAMMSMKGALSAILRRYKVIRTPEKGPIPQMKMKFDIMMKAVDDYQIELQRK